MFITAFTSAPTCPYPEPARSSPYPHIPLPEDTSKYSRIDAWVSQVVSFPQVSTPNVCIHLSSPIRATRPSHLILLDFINRKILVQECRSLSSSLCTFLHSPVTSSLLDPNILLSTLFSNTVQGLNASM